MKKATFFGNRRLEGWKTFGGSTGASHRSSFQSSRGLRRSDFRVHLLRDGGDGDVRDRLVVRIAEVLGVVMPVVF